MSESNKELINRLDTLISHLEVLNNLVALDVIKDLKTPTERIGMLLGSGLKQSVIADLLWTKQNIVGAVKSNLEKAMKKPRKNRGKKTRSKRAVVEKGAEGTATNQPSASSDIK